MLARLLTIFRSVSRGWWRKEWGLAFVFAGIIFLRSCNRVVWWKAWHTTLSHRTSIFQRLGLKSFSVITGERNAKTTRLQSLFGILEKAVAYREEKDSLQKWKNIILILISCFKPFFLLGDFVSAGHSLTGYEWLCEEDSNTGFRVLQGSFFWSRQEKKKKVPGWESLVKFPLSLTTVPQSDDPLVARSGGSGSGLHCESKASQASDQKGIFPRDWKEKLLFNLVNPSQEVW